MENNNWQDPFQNESLKNQNFSGQDSKQPSPNSFASQFTQAGQIREEETFNGPDTHHLYSDQYSQTTQYQEPIPDNHNGLRNNLHQTENYTADTQESEQVYLSNTIHDDDMAPSTWKFLDLKNKKQTGDLYKKILSYNKNNNKVFNFLSSRPREGVSTIVANVVEYIRRQTTDKKILVIDANFQSPSLHKVFNIPGNTYGLADILNKTVGIRDAITPISTNIFFIASGIDSHNQSGDLDQDNFVKLLNECRQLVDYILIDCPPALSSSDSMSIAPAADISFFLVGAVQVQKEVAQKAISVLQNDECKIGGVILNRMQQVIPGWVYRFI